MWLEGERGGEGGKAEGGMVVIGADRATSMGCREDLGCYSG